MKLLAALMVVLAGAVSADEDFYSPSAPAHQPQYSSYSSYYDQPPRQSSFLDLFWNNRRQGLGGILGGGGGGGIGAGIAVVGVLLVLGLGMLAVAALVSTSSSGRGLDTDQWEVDHSVWLDQLKEDFEDSWSTQ